jgi:hypothetical protein
MKKTLLLCLSIIVGVTFISCSNDDNDELDTSDPAIGTITPNSALKVLSYDKFLTENDVTIQDADTTTIEVSKAYLKSINITLETGDVVTIWRNLNELPFVRNITGVREQGGNIFITTVAGDISDALQDANVDLSSELFYDPAGATKAAQYTDGTTIHPAAVIFRYSDSENKDGEPHPDEGVEVKNMMSDMPQAKQGTRGTAKWHIIDETFNTDVTLGPSNLLSMGITGGTTHIYAEFDMSITVKWFKLKKFSSVFKGGMDMHMPLTLTATQPVVSFDRELTIYRFLPHCFVYWVGPVPVGVSVEPSIVLDLTAGVDAQVSLTLPVNYSNSFSIGPVYNGKWGYECNLTNSHSIDARNITLGGTLSAHAGLGLMFKTGVYLYGFAGPYVMFGPTAEFSADATVSTTAAGKRRANVTLNGSLIARAKLGAELKIHKWRLAYWEKNWDIAQWTLWSKEVWSQDLN